MTIRHPEEEELITLALGDLETPERRGIQDHLDRCPDCRVAAGSIQEILEVGRAGHLPAPDSVLVRLLLARAPRRWWFASLLAPPRIAVAAMFVTAFFFAGFWTGRFTKPFPEGTESLTMRSRALPDLPAPAFQAVPALDLHPASGIPAGWVGNGHDSTAGDSL